MASESDGIATSDRRGWLDIINGIGWPNLPGIEFDHTDDPDAVEENNSANDSDKEEYYKRVDANFEVENAFMMEHMSRMCDDELLTYAAELIKFRRLKDFIYSNRLQDELTESSDNLEFLEYEILKCSRDSGYARWIIEDEDLTVNFIAAVDPEDYDGEIYREYFGDDDYDEDEYEDDYEEYSEDYDGYDEDDIYEENLTSERDEDPKPAKYLGERFEPELASIEYSGRSYTLGLAREGIDRGNEGSNFNLYDSSPEYANDPELPMGHEGRVLAWFDNKFNTQSSITGEPMMGWRFEDDVTEAERNRAVAAVVSMAQKMGAARWSLECLKMLDDRYEELLNEEKRERSGSQLGRIATELSDIE